MILRCAYILVGFKDHEVTQNSKYGLEIWLLVSRKLDIDPTLY
jgi:hypothetical protein